MGEIGWLQVAGAGFSALLAAFVWLALLWAYRRPPWVVTAWGASSRGWQEIAVRVVVHNLGISPIYLPREGHAAEFPIKMKGAKRAQISIVDLEKPSSNPIMVPPFGMADVGTSVFSPLVTMVAGRGLENEPHFNLLLKDSWGREASACFLLPDTLVKAVPNAETGEWEYPVGERLVMNVRSRAREGQLTMRLQERASKVLGKRGSVERIWPRFPEDVHPPEPRKHHVFPPVEERESVVAFIDILGFKQLMRSNDAEKRSAAIRLLERLVENSSNHGIEIRDLGLGAQIVINPEASTFSDNVVLSFPVQGVRHPVPGGVVTESASRFMTNLVTMCVSTYWQGLHLGLLFRGGISIGRLYHAANVVAGAGMVDAVELERDTKWPRIAVDPRVLDATDERGQPIVEPHVREFIIQDPDDGTYHLDTMSFHMGVWWDYFHFVTGDPKGTWVQVRQALESIRATTDSTIAALERQVARANGKEREGLQHAADKWQWFKERFDEAQRHDDWAHIWNPPKEPQVQTVGPGDPDLVQDATRGA